MIKITLTAKLDSPTEVFQLAKAGETVGGGSFLGGMSQVAARLKGKYDEMIFTYAAARELITLPMPTENREILIKMLKDANQLTPASKGDDTMPNPASDSRDGTIIRDGGRIALSQGDNDWLRITLFSDPETFIWIEFDDADIDNLITQLQRWRHHRIIGTPQ